MRRRQKRASTASSSWSQHKSLQLTFYISKHLEVSRMTKRQQLVENQINPGITVSLGSTVHFVPKETTPKVSALLRMTEHSFNGNKSLDNNRDAKKSCTLLSWSALQVKRCLQPSSCSSQQIWKQLFHRLAVLLPGKALEYPGEKFLFLSPPFRNYHLLSTELTEIKWAIQ